MESIGSAVARHDFLGRSANQPSQRQTQPDGHLQKSLLGQLVGSDLPSDRFTRFVRRSAWQRSLMRS